ncbi:5262_t:CDS:10 [Diversispora eburnea]|uniref:5262_t:CDS:1 n=1 Tax=Diversispora eburnea TaxID=1213867 RepID=A0A9N9AWD8_9GLOM|nr:5262_t:CDS:10 [Diversispora eburnea]
MSIDPSIFNTFKDLYTILSILDPRFEHVRKDPRFGRPQKKDTKIKLDSRFAQMLKNEDFTETHDNEIEIYPEEEIPHGEETHRFAVLNLDWDNVNAVDLMKLFCGFKLEGSIIKSVRIYPSQFGKERLEKFDQDLLRKYQLERLRYYYAVVDCDTVENARQIYNQCDGAEFECSANFLDLRFIPDDTEFDNEEIRDECQHEPEVYKPVNYVTDALNHSNVKLTWDNDDPYRVKLTKQSFKKKDLDVMDFKAYLASSSDEDSGSDIEVSRQKYKDLLNKVESNDQSDSIKNETTIESYMRKQREKKKVKESNKTNKITSRKEEERQRAELELLVNDPRFAALHKSHHFAIDPSNPHFKKTEAMTKLLEESQRRQSETNKKKEKNIVNIQEEYNNFESPFKDPSLSSLVNSVWDFLMNINDL